MHQFLRAGARRAAAPVLTAALVAAGVTGLALGPRAVPPVQPGTVPVAVTDDGGVRLGPATKYVLGDDGEVRRIR